MKKKFLVPIMALAIAVTAGVNYKMIGEQMNSLKSNLADICSVSTAQAEWGYDPNNYVAEIIGQYEPIQDQYGHWHTVWVEYCIGSGYLFC